MTIAITGAAGQLGRLTAQLVLDRVPADEVVLVTRRPAAIADLAEAGATVRHGDFDEPSSLPAAFAGVDRLLLDQHRRARQPGGSAHRRHRRRGRGRRRPRALHVGPQRGQRAPARRLSRPRRDRAGDPRPRPALDGAAQRPLRRVPGRRGGACRRVGPPGPQQRRRRDRLRVARGLRRRGRGGPDRRRSRGPDLRHHRTRARDAGAAGGDGLGHHGPSASRPSPSTTRRRRTTSPPWACPPTRRWPTHRSARRSAKACSTS